MAHKAAMTDDGSDVCFPKGKADMPQVLQNVGK